MKRILCKEQIYPIKKVMHQDFASSWYITLVFRLKSRFLVPMYHESAYLWYITFEGRFRGEYSGNSGGLFLLQDYLGEAVEGTDADSSGGGVRYHGFCGSFVRSCAVRNTGRARCRHAVHDRSLDVLECGISVAPSEDAVAFRNFEDQILASCRHETAL